MFEVIQNCAQIGCERLAAHVMASADVTREARIDIMDWTWRITLDIIGQVAFDHDYQSGESADAKALQQTWRKCVDASLEKAAFIVSATIF